MIQNLQLIRQVKKTLARMLVMLCLMSPLSASNNTPQGASEYAPEINNVGCWLVQHHGEDYNFCPTSLEQLSKSSLGNICELLYISRIPFMVWPRTYENISSFDVHVGEICLRENDRLVFIESLIIRCSLDSGSVLKITPKNVPFTPKSVTFVPIGEDEQKRFDRAEEAIVEGAVTFKREDFLDPPLDEVDALYMSDILIQTQCHRIWRQQAIWRPSWQEKEFSADHLPFYRNRSIEAPGSVSADEQPLSRDRAETGSEPKSVSKPDR